MELNERLVALRKKKGLSQAELAEAIKVSRQAISRWEVGTAIPSADNLMWLSKFYEMSMDELMGTAVNGTADKEDESSKELDEQQLKQEQSGYKRNHIIKKVVKWFFLVIGIMLLGTMVFVLIVMR